MRASEKVAGHLVWRGAHDAKQRHQPPAVALPDVIRAIDAMYEIGSASVPSPYGRKCPLTMEKLRSNSVGDCNSHRIGNAADHSELARGGSEKLLRHGGLLLGRAGARWPVSGRGGKAAWALRRGRPEIMGGALLQPASRDRREPHPAVQ